MSLLYVATPRKNPQDGNAPAKYYLQSKIRGHKKHKDILAAAAKNTTLSNKEVDMAVSAFFESLFESLSDGFSVEVESLGTFSTSIKSEGAASESEATAATVTNIGLAFRSKPEVYERVNKFKLEKYVPGSTL